MALSCIPSIRGSFPSPSPVDRPDGERAAIRHAHNPQDERLDNHLANPGLRQDEGGRAGFAPLR